MPKRLLLAFALITVVILTGTIGYIILEKLNPLEAFYYTVITISTVGYEDIATSQYTKIFTIILILLGVAAFFYFFGIIVEILIEGRLFEVLKLRKIKEKLNKVNEHVILCGYGDVGALVAEKIKNLVIVEENENRFNELVENGFLGVHGDSVGFTGGKVDR